MTENSKIKPTSFKDFKKILKSVSPSGILSLLEYVNPFLDVFFAMALIFALLKDLVDITVGLIPIVGQILAFIIALLCGIFIFLIMLILGANQMKAIAKRSLVIILGSLADAIPVINLFPVETAVVIISYFMILNERKTLAEEKQKAEQQFAQEDYATQEV
jgi:hypothetical protein